MVLRFRPTLTRFPTNTLSTQDGSTPNVMPEGQEAVLPGVIGWDYGAESDSLKSSKTMRFTYSWGERRALRLEVRFKIEGNTHSSFVDRPALTEKGENWKTCSCIVIMLDNICQLAFLLTNNRASNKTSRHNFS